MNSMLKTQLIILAFAGALLSAGISSVTAQTPDAQQTSVERPPRMPDAMPLLRQLGLTPEQAQQLRRMNQARRPKMDEAQAEFRTANEELDAAIYADTVDETLIAEKIKRVEQAQAKLTRLRFENELAIRKILTPEQLVRFREARERIRRAQVDLQERRMDGLPPNRNARPGGRPELRDPALNEPPRRRPNDR